MSLPSRWSSTSEAVTQDRANGAKCDLELAHRQLSFGTVTFACAVAAAILLSYTAGGPLLANLLLGLAAAMTLVETVRRDRLLLPSVYIYKGLFVVSVCVSLLINGALDPSVVQGVVLQAALLVALWTACQSTYLRMTRAVIFMNTVFVSGLVLLAIGLVERHGLGAVLGSQPFVALGLNANRFSILLTLSVSAGWYHLLHTPSAASKTFSGLGIVLLIYGILASGSRTGTIAVLVFFVAYWILGGHRGLRVGMIARLFIALGVVLSAVLLLQRWSPGFGSTFIGEKFNLLLKDMGNLFVGQSVGDSSLDGRSSMLALGLELFASRPLFGIGYGNFVYYSAKVLGWGTYSHSNYIEVLSGTGLFGFVPYVLLYGSLILRGTRLVHESGEANAMLRCLLAMTMTICVINLFSINDESHIVYLWLGVLVALESSAPRCRARMQHE